MSWGDVSELFYCLALIDAGLFNVGPGLVPGNCGGNYGNMIDQIEKALWKAWDIARWYYFTPKSRATMQGGSPLYGEADRGP